MTMAAPGTPKRAAPARVLVVEDHAVLRGVVRMACEDSPALEVVGEARSGEEALAACRSLRPDVMVLDLSLPDLDGVEVTRRLRAEAVPVRILVLTGRADDQTVFESLRAGADGFLEKTVGVRYIAAAVERVAAGERLFTPEQERAAVVELGRHARQAREVSGIRSLLTPRELEILEYARYGFTMRQIASRLGLSPRTVETHVAKLYKKLGVRNRVQAVSRASALGLIDLS